MMFNTKMKPATASTYTVFLILKRAFKMYGYGQAEWKCVTLIEPSHRAALCYGFSSHFCQHYIRYGRNCYTI